MDPQSAVVAFNDRIDARDLDGLTVPMTDDHTSSGVKAPGTDSVFAAPDTVVPSKGVLIVAGTTDRVERFAATTQ